MSPSATPAKDSKRADLTLETGGSTLNTEHAKKHEGQPTLPKQDPVAAARDWRETLRSTPGHEEGYSAGPEEALKTFNVSSAAQLPYILAELNAHGGSIRLDFPVGSPENLEVSKEQQAIREFLQKHHNTDLEQLKHELTQFLGDSPSYVRLAAQADFTLKFPTARDWVATHLDQGISSDASLKVADIISAEEISNRAEPDLLVSLEESAKAGRETIITTPPQGEQLESIRQKLQDLVSKDEKLLDKQISVWTNVSSTTIRRELFKVRSIEQLTLREFLATAPIIKENAEPSSANSGAPANQSETKDSVPGSKPEPTTDSALGHSLILSSGTGAPKTEMTPVLPQNMPHQKLSVEEQVALWTNKLADVEKRQESLRNLLPLADNLVSLEGKFTWAKNFFDLAFLKVKPLLEPEPQAEARETERKQGQKAQNSEIDRARNHNSDEGRAFKKSFYILQGAQQTLAAARKKLLEASTEAGLDSVLTPKGETAPIITNQTILKALRREGKYAGKLRNKIRRAGGMSTSARSEDTAGETTSDPSHEGTRSRRDGNNAPRPGKHDRQLEKLERTIAKKSADLNEARKMFERADKMEGPWETESKLLDTRLFALDEARKALDRITELETLQTDPKTKGLQNVSEIQTILQKYDMRTAKYFREWHNRKRMSLDEDLADFAKSNDKKKAYWTQRIIELEKELETLRAKLPKPDVAPSDSPTETQVSEQTDSAQDSELTTSDTSAADGTASS